jgi:hypothetical protein
MGSERAVWSCVRHSLLVLFELLRRWYPPNQLLCMLNDIHFASISSQYREYRNT